jgi:hypothetical protein
MMFDYAMPTRKQVEEALLKSLLKHNGVIKEFNSDEKIVNEIANKFNLNDNQRTVALERIYHKENRIVKSPLWHRLLFRAADALAKEKLVSRPTTTIHLTNKREWMLTESGYDKALELMNIPISKKEILQTKSYEVQKIVKKLIETKKPENYDPFDKTKKTYRIEKEITLRARGFRQAVIEAYDFRCAVCGMKVQSPDALSWEVEAAHIVPHSSMGKDDIWNGLSLCHFHHWAFDVGWFSIKDDYKLIISSKTDLLSSEIGNKGNSDLFNFIFENNSKIILPDNNEIFPHINSIRWHRENIFFH